jgi:NhaP-type Na+/H+ or K+/H+ antiporter
MDLAVLAAVIGGYALVSRRLSTTVVSLAMVMVVGGYLAGPEVLGVFDPLVDETVLKLAAEATLAFVLFDDASRISVTRLRHEAAIPVRLLCIGLPLTILAGALVGGPLLGGLDASEAFVLAVVLAPTDAALGQAVVTEPRLPSRVRQGLNVESGLNDGICVPLLFVALAAEELSLDRHSATTIVTDLVEEVGLATVAGVMVAVLVAVTLRWSMRRGWIDDVWQRIVPPATAVAAYGVALQLGGSAFIAAFVAGFLFGYLVRRLGIAPVRDELLEEVGGVLNSITFFLFGALIGPLLDDLSWREVGYAVASLTVVRMVPVALSLIGTGVRYPTRLYMGWFGPRGLASIVFALIVVEDADVPGTSTIVRVAALTVVLSVVLHGMSAGPLTARYLRWFESLPAATAPEHQAVPEPRRRGHRWHRSPSHP